MKKLFMLFAGLLFIIGLQAQTSGTTYTLPTGTTYYNAFSLTRGAKWAVPNLVDTIGGTAVNYWIFSIKKPQLYYYQFFVEYDTVLYNPAGHTMRTVGNQVQVWLDGSIDGTYFVAVDSIIFDPTTSFLPTYQQATPASALVSTLGLRDVTTGVLYRYLKIRAVGVDAGKCSLISKLSVKVGLRY
jgi:hypothetical protein